MKVEGFYSMEQIKSSMKGADSEKNFPAVVRPARRLVKHQESCGYMSSNHQGKVSLKPKK